MLEYELAIAIGSAGAAVLNGIGLIIMWRRYLSLADSSLAFAGDVVGHLVAYPDGTGEVKDPMGLIATTLVHLDDLTQDVR